MKNKGIMVTMTKTMYDLLLKGRKNKGDDSFVKGCGTKENLIKYINDTFGLLGDVSDVAYEE